MAKSSIAKLVDNVLKGSKKNTGSKGVNLPSGRFPRAPESIQPEFEVLDPYSLPEFAKSSLSLSDVLDVSVSRASNVEAIEEFVNRNKPRNQPGQIPDIPEDWRERLKRPTPFIPAVDDDETDEGGPRGPFAAVDTLGRSIRDDELQLAESVFALKLGPKRELPDKCPYNPQKCEAEPTDCETIEEILSKTGFEMAVCPLDLGRKFHLHGAT